MLPELCLQAALDSSGAASAGSVMEMPQQATKGVR